MSLRNDNFKIAIPNSKQIYTALKSCPKGEIYLYPLGEGYLRIKDRKAKGEKIPRRSYEHPLCISSDMVQHGILKSYYANISTNGASCCTFFYARAGDNNQNYLLKLPLEELTERFGTINFFQGISKDKENKRRSHPYNIYPEMTFTQVCEDSRDTYGKTLFSIIGDDRGNIFISAGVSQNNTVYVENEVPLSPAISLKSHALFSNRL